MTSRNARTAVEVVVSDVRFNRARRIRHAIRWRVRRLRHRVANVGRDDLGVVYPVSFGPNGERLLASLRSGVGEARTPLMFGGAFGATSRVVHIESTSIRDFCRRVLDIGNDDGLIVRAPGVPDEALSERSVERLVLLGRSFELLVVEVAVESVMHVQCSQLTIAVWSPGTGPYSTSFYESDFESAVVGRLTPPLFHSLAAAGHDFDEDFPAPDQPRFPIDIVYTWVDGDDPDWLNRKHEFQSSVLGDAPVRVVHDERFRTRDELKYSLRSVELFAPWVRKIHIVTADQCPDWLDTSHPKINMVSHSDIYADGSWLPTFNSSGIETQLHHVPDLAQHFLYFNDDFLLGQLTNPGDFFLANGALRFFPSEQRAYEAGIDESSEEYIQADKNAIELFKPIMSEVGRSIMRHVPYPSDRDLLFEMEERWPAEFAACASSRFRSRRDLRPIAFMQYHYGFGVQKAVESIITHRYLALWKPTILEQLERVEADRAYKTICINDVGADPSRIREIDLAVAAFLESYFPTRSSFEVR